MNPFKKYYLVMVHIENVHRDNQIVYLKLNSDPVKGYRDASWFSNKDAAKACLDRNCKYLNEMIKNPEKFDDKGIFLRDVFSDAYRIRFYIVNDQQAAMNCGILNKSKYYFGVKPVDVNFA